VQSQHTPQGTIAKEKQTIANLLNLPGGAYIFLNDIGWDSRVYIINSGEFVFKFPRSEIVRKAYQQEIAGYKLAGQIKSAILVPEVRWEHPNNDYFGYEGIVGNTLEDQFHNLSEERKIEIGKDLGTFLKQLHDLKLEGIPTMTLEEEIAEFQEKYRIGLPELKRNFTETQQSQIERLVFEIYPKKVLGLKMDQALCHGDLGYWNIIYGKNDQVGIIDFGDLGYYDRSKDFIGVNEQKMLDAVLSQYGDNEILREKIGLRKKILAILDLPYFIGKNNQEGIQKTIMRIRAMAFE
jgi:aminoglycoside phosphotransferase (APT) family kinase protein